jgi:hypothetical protein
VNDEERRIANTEAIFRDVNERIAESAQRFAAPEASFVCECDDAACTERVDAELDDYEAVRSNGARFLLVPGHADERIERVVKRRRRYHVVEKVNAAIRAQVRRLDPRAA